MSNLQIPAGSEVILKSKYNQKFLGYKQQTQTFSANFPPYCVNTNMKNIGKVDRTLRFEILSYQGDKSQFISQGSKVHLRYIPHSDQQQQGNSEIYLSCTAKSEVKFDKKTSSQKNNQMLLKSALWTISYASYQKELIPPSRSDLKIFDNVVLKSIYGSYLTVNKLSLAASTTLQMEEEKSIWNIQFAGSLPVPSWLYEKQSFSKYNRLQGQQIVNINKRNLRSHPPEIQQALLVQDLLDVLIGFEGTYIKKKIGSPYYVIQPHLQSPSCNIAISQLTYRIIELASHYQRLMKFMKQQEYKQSILSQALCDGLMSMIYQYYHQINRLDDRQGETGLSLQTMWVQIQDSLKIMRALGDLITAATNLRGGQLISALLKLINETTDRHVLVIYKHLNNKLIKLYVGMLSKWIYEGKLEDRHKQFMICADRQSLQWENWEQNFKLRTQMIPSILQRDAQTILVTGKYINILKACNKQINCPFAKQIENNLDHYANKLNFTEPIQKAYEWANQQLLQLITKQYKLQEVVTSLKGYFFLNYGDLFLYFLEGSIDDIALPKKIVQKNDGRKQFSLQKLQTIFELSVRTSTALNDNYKDDVSLKLQYSSIFEQINRIKSFESDIFSFRHGQKAFIKKDSRYIDYIVLDYKCPFPLNLILNKRAISKYQCLFRLMIWFKFLQRQLNICWMKLQNTSESNVQCFKIAYTTNSKITKFVQSLLYYLTEEVIEQNMLKLLADFKKAKNFEDIIQSHEKFLNTCLKQSLLTNQTLLQILTSDIGNTIMSYFKIKEYLEEIQEELNNFRETKPLLIHERRQYMRDIQKQVSDLIEEKRVIEFITVFKNNFDDLIKKFIRQLSESTAKEENYLLRLSEMLSEENYMNNKYSYK